jgi:hypothetical protein
MKANSRHRILAASLSVAALAVSVAPVALICAVTSTPLTQSAPAAANSQQPKPKTLKFHGVVMSFSTASITLRGQQNPREVQSFTFTPQLHDKVVALMKKGGYQNGDKVTVKYAEGTEVAIEISGKPSKPKTF